MRITLLQGVKGTPDRGTVLDIDAGAFLDLLGDAGETPSVECASEDDKRAGRGFVFGQYRKGATSKHNSQLAESSATDLLCFDVDDVELAAVEVAIKAWARVDSVVYSTWKHTPDAPRLRVVVRLTRPVGNATDDDFRTVYGAVAQLLRIPYDASASNRANFYFEPQHKPGANGASVRRRYRGEPLDVDAILEAVETGRITVEKRPATGVDDFDGVRVKPDKNRLRALVESLSKGGEREQKIAAALGAILRGERFALAGQVHNTQVQVAFELVRAVPLVDAEWFADEYLRVCWAKMSDDGSISERIVEDWLKCVSTAEAKLASGKEERAIAAARFLPALPVDLNSVALESAAAIAGGLICEFRGAFYVWDARAGRYVGPLKSTGLAAACRRCLVGVPGFAYYVAKGNGPPTLKSGPKLVEEYGIDLDSVHYHAIAPGPGMAFDRDKRLIRVPAYQWNTFEARYSEIADELLRAISGEQYGKIEAWLYKLRDLRQPLPALCLVGARGTWKSRLAQTLSRFWGTPDAPSPCDAMQVLNRFSGPLLYNPLIWSDEQLARSEGGHPIPEAYRRSITETAHFVERKGLDPVTLHTATRHVISVNDVDKIFGGEVDASSVEATIERYLVIEVDSAAIESFETKWSGTGELDELREGAPLLGHIRWIEENTTHVSKGRLFVATDTDAELLLRARFSDDTLSICMAIAVDALLRETGQSVPGQIERLPLVCDELGRLRLSPQRIVELWPESKLAAGSGLRKPTAQRVGRMFEKAGLKLHKSERATNSRRFKAWRLNHDRFKEFLVVNDYNWHEVVEACRLVFGVPPSLPPSCDELGGTSFSNDPGGL